MPNNIDERIVEMRFDNRNFESGVNKTIGLLDRLKSALKLEGAVQGFDELDRAASGMDMMPLQTGLDAVTKKFSAMETMVVAALTRITYQAVDTGERLIKSFTIDPITASWDKYESKVASVQKIMNSSADNTMPKVEAALDKIQWFTNETSYQFDAMVSALGSFSAAGIELEKSTNTIIGLANAAAISGVNASDASHAFLGFQRAIGSGYLSLGIWNSYLKTAGFQSAAFIEACIKAGLEVGTLKGTIDKATTSLKGSTVTAATFAETLNEKWVSSDVITKLAENFSVASDQIYKVMNDESLKNINVVDDAIKYLGKDIDEYSLKAFKAGQETKTWGDAVEYVRGTVAQGWSRTWELIFGNYEEAKEFYSTIVEDLYTLFIESGDQRNAFLEEWKELGGRTTFTNGIINIFKILATVVDNVKQAFANLIPPVTVEMAKNLTLGFEQLTVRIAQLLGIEDFADSLSEAVDEVGDALNGVNEAGEKVAGTIEDISVLANAVIRGDYGNGAERIEKLGYKFKMVQNEVNKLLNCSFRYKEAEEEWAEGAAKLAEANGKAAETTSDLSDAAEKGATKTERIQRALTNLASTLRGAFAVVELIAYSIGAVARFLSEGTSYALQFGEGVLGVTGSIGDAIVKFKEFVIENDILYNALKKVGDVLTTIFKPALDTFSGLMEKLSKREVPFLKWVESLNLLNITSEDVAQAMEKLGKSVQNLYDKVSPTFANIKTKVTEFASTVYTKLSENTDLSGIIDVNAIKTPFELIVGIGVAAVNKITKTFNNLKTALKPIGEWFDAYFKPEIIKNLKKLTYSEQLLGAFDPTKDNKIITVYRNFEFISKTISDFIQGIIGEFPFLNKFKKVFETFDGTIASLGRIVGGLASSGIKKLGELFEPVGDFLLYLQGLIAKIDFPRLMGLGILVGIFAIVMQVLRIASSLATAAENVSGLFVGVQSLFKAIKVSVLTTSIISLTACAAVLVGLIYMLANLASKNLGAVWTALGVTLAIFGIFAFVLIKLYTISATVNIANVAKIALSFISVAGSIALMVGALYVLTKFEPQVLLESIGKMAMVFGALAAMLWVLNWKIFNGKNMMDWQKALGFFFFVTALSKAVTILEELSTHKFDEMKEGLKSLAGMAVILVILSAGLSKIKFGSSVGLMALVGALWLFVRMLESFEGKDFVKIYETLFLLSPILILLIAISAIASQASKGAYSLAATMLSLSVMLISLTECVKILGSMDGNQMAQGIGGMTLVLIELIGFVGLLSAILKGASLGEKVGKELLMTFGGLAVAALAIAVAVKIMSGIPWPQLLWSAGALAGVILAFGKAANLSKDFNAKAGPLLVMAGLLLTITVSLLILSFIKPEDLIAPVLGLTLVLGAMGFVLSQLKGFTNAKNYVTIAVGIGALLIAIAGSLWILLETGAKWQEMLAAAVGLSVVLGTFAIVMASIKAIGVVPQGAILSFLEIAGVVTLAIVAIGALVELIDTKLCGGKGVDYVLRGLDKVAKIFAKFGEILGAVFGGLVAGFNDAATSNLETVADRLDTFTTKIQPFLDYFASNNLSWSKVVENTGHFHTAISNLSKASKFTTGFDETKLTNGLTTLSSSLSAFYDNIKESKIDVYKAKAAAEAISTLTSIVPPDYDGNADAWNNVAKGLEGLGNALVSFSSVVSGEDAVNFDDVRAGFDLISELGKAVKKIDTSSFEGWSKLIGVDEFKMEGEESENAITGLEKMGQTLQAFSTSMEGVDFDNAGKAIQAINDIAAIAATVPNAGEKIQAWFGPFGVTAEKEGFSWSALYKGLCGSESEPGLGQSLITLSHQGYSIMGSGLDKALEGIGALATMASEFPVFRPGFMQWFTGDDTLEGFAVALSRFIPQLKEFYDKAKGVNYEDAIPAFNLINRIRALADELGESVGTESNLAKAGINLIDFTNSFQGLVNVLKQIDEENPDSGTDFLGRIGAMMDNIGSMFSEERIQTIIDAGDMLAQKLLEGMTLDPNQKMTASVDAWIERLSNEFGVIREAIVQQIGITIAENIANGFKSSDSMSKVESAVNVLLPEMVKQIRAHYGAFVQAGEYLVLGLIEGISNKAADAVAEAQSLGEQVNAAFQAATGQASPSKLWAKYGEYLIAGLTNGMDRSENEAVNSARGLAMALNGEFSSYAAPRISPVVDMGSTIAARQKISSMLDTTRVNELAESSISVNNRIDKIGDLLDVTRRIYKTVDEGQFGNTNNITFNGASDPDMQELSDFIMDELNKRFSSSRSRWAR